MSAINLHGTDRIALQDLVPDDYATDGVDSIYSYELGGGVRLFLVVLQGRLEWATIWEDNIVTMLTEWWKNSTDICELAEWLSEWKQDGRTVLTPVADDDDYHGPCRVWQAPCWQHGACGAPIARFARDENDEILEFASPAEARAYVEGIRQCNVLAHGQAGPDTLTIVRTE